jgi:SAM-dependent methyltransferase
MVRALPEPIRFAVWRLWHAVRGWPEWAPEPQAQSEPGHGFVAARDRRSILLEHVDKAGLGLEIGPSHSPVAPRRDGFRVEIIDHASREDLVAKYAAHGVDSAAIEDVDFVWDGRRYAELTGRPHGYDWVIASHVIEHVPDLVGFLADCDAILREDGMLSLAVPDKRYCFDRMRPHTGLQAVVDAHREGRTNHTPGRVAEYFLNVVALRGRVAWAPVDAEDAAVSDFAFVHGGEDARNGMRAVENDNTYLDIHAWCFTPSSFRLLIEDLHALGMVAMREVAYHEGVGEFFVTLSRSGKGHGLDRMELLARVERELAAVAMPGQATAA